MILTARFKNLLGLFLLAWMEELGCNSRISLITSRNKYVTSLTASEPSSLTPPVLT